MVEVRLYTKAGCTLCEEVKAELAALASTLPHRLTEVDITANHDLFARYRYLIPVLEVGTARLMAPIDPDRLKLALETAVTAAAKP